MKFQDYETEGFFDELFDVNGSPRPEAEPLFRRFSSLSEGEVGRTAFMAVTEGC